jgi:toxoflavin synthase
MASAPPKGQIYDSVAGDYDIIWNVAAVKILFPLLDTNLKRLGPWHGASVLDMACGTGIGLREMKKLGATKLVGIDISSEMLAVAEQTSGPDAGFELHHADCSKPFDHLGLPKDSFDLVIGMWLVRLYSVWHGLQYLSASSSTIQRTGSKCLACGRTSRHI